MTVKDDGAGTTGGVNTFTEIVRRHGQQQRSHGHAAGGDHE